MMPAVNPRVDIVSIGTLSSNPFWGEKAAVRPSHATTTLIRDGKTHILVDPSLPAKVLFARLEETTGVKAEQIDVVFLTNFRPVHRRGLEGFESATWLLGEVERSFFLGQLSAHKRSGEGASSEEVAAELALLKRTQPAPDKLSANVHLFPSYGVTPGSCSLLVSGLRTMVVAGDAIITRDYFDHGRVFERASDFEKAKESFADITEVADLIVPGHDNFIFPN